MAGSLVNVSYTEMVGLEYIIQSAQLSTPSDYNIISDMEGFDLYFDHNDRDSVNVYVVTGAQKGDEAKAKTTDLIMRTDLNVKWAYAPNSTHNAGKGINTEDIHGNPVRISLHLCPKTLTDSHIQNYIGPNTQVNPISLQTEVQKFIDATHKSQLGIDYHLMLDAKANLVVPTNRADDIVGKINAMGSTISGATSSAMYAAGKKAPLVEDILYDHKEFLKKVRDQIKCFNDSLKYDSEFLALGISTMQDLGLALQDEDCFTGNARLKALHDKLSEVEIQFFAHLDPAQFLLEQYQSVMNKNLFYVGDTRKEIDNLIELGYSGIVEGVQSTLLSGGIKYSTNRTAAHTDSMGTIGDAGLTNSKISYRRVSVFKMGNTSVGGNGKTMSGFIRQDQLSLLSAISPKTGKLVTFEKTAALEDFLPKEQIVDAFKEVNHALYHAMQNNYSLHDSKVQIKGIDADFSLVEANALLSAYVFGETGETSKRSRICRLDDMIETGVVYNVEGKTLQVRNALDRGLEMQQIGIITGYKVIKPYRHYNVGEVINPGDPLLREELTVEACIPIIEILPSWSSLFADGTNNVEQGKALHPNLCQYLDKVSAGRTVIAVGHGRHTQDVSYIKKE